MAKMRSAAVQMLTLINDDMCAPKPPQRALLELEGLKRDISRREPEELVDARTFSKTVNDALDAQERALATMVKAAAWEEEDQPGET